jgi:hypothetical protein
MIAAVAAIFAGIRIAMPDWLKAAAFIFLGIQTGTTVTWETVARAGQWPLSIAFLGLTVVAVTWGCMHYYRRLRGWDMATAFFASLPGALSLVVALAGETRADMARVTIAQCIRLFFLVAALPAVIAQLSPAASAGVAPAEAGGLMELAVLIVFASTAGVLLERLHVPAGLILGPLAVAATLVLSGAIAGAAPAGLLIPANVVLGVMIAVRFQHFSFADFRRALGEGFAGFLIALVISAAGAGIASAASGLPLALTLLAFSPGGLDAMTIMAFALGLDPAYVAAHQIARYAAMALALPWIAALILHRERAHPPAGQTPAHHVEED